MSQLGTEASKNRVGNGPTPDRHDGDMRAQTRSRSRDGTITGRAFRPVLTARLGEISLKACHRKMGRVCLKYDQSAIKSIETRNPEG